MVHSSLDQPPVYKLRCDSNCPYLPLRVSSKYYPSRIEVYLQRLKLRGWCCLRPPRLHFSSLLCCVGLYNLLFGYFLHSYISRTSYILCSDFGRAIGRQLCSRVRLSPPLAHALSQCARIRMSRKDIALLSFLAGALSVRTKAARIG